MRELNRQQRLASPIYGSLHEVAESLEAFADRGRGHSSHHDRHHEVSDSKEAPAVGCFQSAWRLLRQRKRWRSLGDTVSTHRSAHKNLNKSACLLRECDHQKLPPINRREHRIFRLKPAVRLERRGQHGQNKTDQRDHRANLADSGTR